MDAGKQEAPTLPEIAATTVSSYTRLQKLAAITAALIVFTPVALNLVDLQSKISYVRGKTHALIVMTEDRVNAKATSWLKNKLAELGIGKSETIVVNNSSPSIGEVRRGIDEAEKNISPDQPTTKVDKNISSKVEQPGQVLGTSISSDQIVSALRTVLADGLPEDLKLSLQGPPGPAGPQGPAGTSPQYIPNSGSTFGVVTPTVDTTHYSSGGGTIGGVTYGSSDQFSARKLTVSENADLHGNVSISGATTLTGSLSLTGNLTLSGDLLAGSDNTYNIGSTAIRWASLHAGPAGLIVHNDATNAKKVSLVFNGSTAVLGSDALTPLQLTTGSNAGINILTNGNVGIGTTNATTPLDVSGTSTFEGNIIQTDAYTFSTGTGSISLNGDTTLAAGKNFVQSGTGTFTTGSGLATIGGNLTVSGNTISLANNSTIDESAGTLSINTTTNRPIITGSGLTTLGGNLTVSGNTVILANNSTIDETAGTLSLNTTNNRPITTGSGLTTLGGNLSVAGTAISLAAGSTIDQATGTLSINTTNNRPVTFGSGNVTIPNLVVTNSQSNAGTMTINSNATTQTIFSVIGPNLTSGTAIQKTITANAGNGQITHGEILNLTDSTLAGGGFTGIGITVTGAGTGSGSKYLLDLNPNVANNEVVFDNTGALRPTTAVSNNTNTVGSPSFYWKNGYFDQITANNLSGTVVTGATSSTTWTIGSTQVGDVNEAIIFQRNSGSGNATIQWNAGAGDLRYLSVNYPLNNTYTVTDGSIGTGVNLYSGNLTNNTTSGTQKLLSLTNTGTGTTENGIYLDNTGTGTTGIEIHGTWGTGILTDNNSINAGTGAVSGGAATFATVNKLTLTQPATSATLTIADGKTLTASNTLTFTGTDGSSVAFGTGGTVVYTTRTINGKSLASDITLNLASADFANQGTATTVLHGNAAGNPSWGAIVSADLNITPTTCTNQAVTAISSAAAGSCSTITSAYVDSSIGLTANPLSQFAATTSAQLAGVLSDETGSAAGGLAVFNNGPIITNPVITNIAPGADFTLTQNAVTPLVSVNAGAVANTLYLKAGNVGIGTNAPASKLDVFASGVTDVTTNGIRVNRPDSYGQFGFMGYGNSSSTTYIGSSYTGGIASNYGQIQFRQYSSSGVPLDSVIIDNSGKVGIGTTVPGTKLSVYDSTAGDREILTLANTAAFATTNKADMDFDLNTDAALRVAGQISVSYPTPADATRQSQMDFMISNSGALIPAMTIRGSNVGIGTTNPTAMFSVGSSSQFQVSSAGAITGISLNVGTGTITSGLINSQTISSAADFTGTLNVATGFRIAGIATSGNVLRGNGTNFVSATLAAADLSNGTTGSGAVVLANTPTLITPNIGAATGSSLNLGSGTITSGAINGQTISSSANFTGTLTAAGLITAPNFADATGNYNVNLGSGGSEGRGLVAGFSGGSYGGIGYNVRHTAVGATWIAPSGDTSSYILFNGGGFSFYGAPGGVAGRTLSYSTLMSISSAGAVTAGTYNGQTISSAANFTGTLAVASTVTGGTYNGQTISSAANFTGTVAAATSVTAPSLAVTSNGQFMAGNVAQNLKYKAGGGTDVGISAYNSSDTWVWQLYGSGSSYGFLNGNWAGWDLQKVVGGALTVTGGSGAISAGLYNGQTISSSANFTGTVTIASTLSLNGYGLTAPGGSYGGLSVNSSKNSYYGINMAGTDANATLMYDSAGNGGIYYASAGLWEQYFLRSTNHLMINTSTDLGYALSVNGDVGVNAGNFLRAQYTQASNNYSSSLNWYGMQLGNNGTNYIVGGRTAVGGALAFVVNNTSDFPTINGTTAMTITSGANVGIGRSPSYRLDVVNSANDWTIVANQNGASNYGILGYGATYGVYSSGPLYGTSTANFGSTVTAPTFSGNLSGNASTATLASTATIYTGRTDAAYYQAMWTTSGSTTLYSTDNVAIYSGGYGAIAFNSHAWTLEGNATYGLYSNTGLDAAGGLWDAGNRVCSSTTCSVSSIVAASLSTSGGINTSTTLTTGGNALVGANLYLSNSSARSKIFFRGDNGTTLAGGWGLYGNSSGAITYVVMYDYAANHVNGGTVQFGADGNYEAADTTHVRVTGNLYAQNGCLYYNNASIGSCVSDQMLKENITDYSAFNLTQLTGLRPVNFYYNGLGGNDTKRQQIGFIAQDVEKVAPELVGTTMVKLHPDDTTMTEVKTVNYGAISFGLVNSVKELDSKDTKIYQGNNLTAGELVSIDPTSSANAIAAVGDAQAVGVVTGPASIGGFRVNLAGQVNLQVSEESGQIHAGDKLAVSEQVAGFASKLTQSGQSIGIALADSSGGTSGTDIIPVLLSIGYQEIKVATNAQGQIVTVDKDYDFAGHAILNVKSITSQSGKWSIDDSGLLVVEKVKAKVVETEKGVTITDHTTAALYCVYVDSGQMKTIPGACDDPNTWNTGTTTNTTSSTNTGTVSGATSTTGTTSTTTTSPTTSTTTTSPTTDSTSSTTPTTGTTSTTLTTPTTDTTTTTSPTTSTTTTSPTTDTTTTPSTTTTTTTTTDTTATSTTTP